MIIPKRLKIPRKLKKQIKKNIDSYFPIWDNRIVSNYYIGIASGRNICRIYKFKTVIGFNRFLKGLTRSGLF